MTLRREKEVIENPSGTGQVRKEGRGIAMVSYSLRIEKGQTTAKAFSGKKQTRVSHKSVSGEITVLDGELTAGSSIKTPLGPFNLMMQDEREFDFYIDGYKVDSKTGRQDYIISGAGSKL